MYPKDTMANATSTRETVFNLALPPRLMGYSNNLKLSQASINDTRTSTARTEGLGSPPLRILANDSKGQCHRYNGKLISPIQTRNLLDKTTRFNTASRPAVMIKSAPVVGKRAHHHGKTDSFVISNMHANTKVKPKTDRTEL